MATTVEIGGVLGHAGAMSTREEVLLILGSTLEVSVSATSHNTPKSQTRNKENVEVPDCLKINMCLLGMSHPIDNDMSREYE